MADARVFRHDKQTTALGREVSNLSSLLEALQSFVILNSHLLEEAETMTARENFNKLEDDFLDSTYVDFIEYMNTERYKDYEEKNLYLVDLFNKVTDKININPYSVRRLIKQFAILQYSPTSISEKDFKSFNTIYEVERDYHLVNFDIIAYKNSSLYANCFGFSIVFSAMLRFLSGKNQKRVTIDDRDLYYMNNYLLSYGFKLYEKVNIVQKAQFILNLISLYRNKGSITNINIINKILSNGSLTINETYLYFDKDYWIKKGKPEDKTGFYFFLVVDVNDRYSYDEILINNNLRKENSIEFSFFTHSDNSWIVDENELYDKGITFTKSKYFLIREVTNYEIKSDGLQIVNSVARQLYNIEDNNNKYSQEITQFGDVKLYEILKLYNVSLGKRSKMSEKDEFIDMTLESPSLDSNILTGTLLDDDIKNKSNDYLSKIINFEMERLSDLKNLAQKVTNYKYKDNKDTLLKTNKNYKQVVTELDMFFNPQKTTPIDDSNYIDFMNELFDNYASEIVNETIENYVIDNFGEVSRLTQFFVKDLNISVEVESTNILDIIRFYSTFYSDLSNVKTLLIVPDYKLGIRVIDERDSTSGLLTFLEDKLEFFERNKLRYFLDGKDKLLLTEKFRTEQNKENFDYHYISQFTALDAVISNYIRNHINAIMFDFVFLKISKKIRFDDVDILDRIESVFLNSIHSLMISIVDDFLIEKRIIKIINDFRTYSSEIVYKVEDFKSIYKEEDFEHLYNDNNKQLTRKERDALVMITENIVNIINCKVSDDEIGTINDDIGKVSSINMYNIITTFIDEFVVTKRITKVLNDFKNYGLEIVYDADIIDAIYKDKDFRYLYREGNEDRQYTRKEKESLTMLTDNISNIINNKVNNIENVNITDSFDISYKTI